VKLDVPLHGGERVITVFLEGLDDAGQPAYVLPAGVEGRGPGDLRLQALSGRRQIEQSPRRSPQGEGDDLCGGPRRGCRDPRPSAPPQLEQPVHFTQGKGREIHIQAMLTSRTFPAASFFLRSSRSRTSSAGGPAPGPLRRSCRHSPEDQDESPTGWSPAEEAARPAFRVKKSMHRPSHRRHMASSWKPGWPTT
jgi:hypothetical protein